MVKDTRTTGGIGVLRALKQPLPLGVKAGNNGLPFALKLRGRWVKVEAVVDRWRIDDEWWREQPISRMYCQCVVDQGLKVTVYQDFVTGEWYWQRV